MRRNAPQPRDAGIFLGGVGVHSLRYGVADERRALFLQQLNQPLLVRHQRINLPRLPVEKRGNGLLLSIRCECQPYLCDVRRVCTLVATGYGLDRC